MYMSGKVDRRGRHKFRWTDAKKLTIQNASTVTSPSICSVLFFRPRASINEQTETRMIVLYTIQWTYVMCVVYIYIYCVGCRKSPRHAVPKGINV